MSTQVCISVVYLDASGVYVHACAFKYVRLSVMYVHLSVCNCGICPHDCL